LKDPLRAQTFDSDEELNHTINGWFEQGWYKVACTSMEKCVVLERNCIKKQYSDLDHRRLQLCFSHYLLINPHTYDMMCNDTFFQQLDRRPVSHNSGNQEPADAG